MFVGVDKDEKAVDGGRVLNNDWLDDAGVELACLAPMATLKLFEVWGFEGFENNETGFMSSAPIIVKLGLSEGGGARFAGFGRLRVSLVFCDSTSTYRVLLGDIVVSSAGITFIIVLTGVDGAGWVSEFGLNVIKPGAIEFPRLSPSSESPAEVFDEPESLFSAMIYNAN